MAYYNAINLKIDNNTIKYDENGQLVVGLPIGTGGAVINDETPSLSTTYSSTKIERIIDESTNIPIATDEALGLVKIDNDTITIDTDGTIHSMGGSSNLPTDINDPQDGDVLVYNELIHKWVNDVGGGGGGGKPITNAQIYALFNSTDEYVTDGDNYSV